MLVYGKVDMISVNINFLFDTYDLVVSNDCKNVILVALTTNISILNYNIHRLADMTPGLSECEQIDTILIMKIDAQCNKHENYAI